MRRIFGAVENSRDGDSLAHRDLVKRVERAHDLTSAKPEFAREREKRGARRSIHREPSLDGSAATDAELRDPNLRVDLVSIHVKSRGAWVAPIRPCNRFRNGAGPAPVRVTIVESRLIDSASTREAGRVDATLLNEHFDDRIPAHRREAIVGEQLRQRENAKAIDRRSRRRELIRMPAAARHQRLVEEADFMIDQNAQPQIVILGGGHRLVEAAE